MVEQLTLNLPIHSVKWQFLRCLLRILDVVIDQGHVAEESNTQAS